MALEFVTEVGSAFDFGRKDSGTGIPKTDKDQRVIQPNSIHSLLKYLFTADALYKLLYMA